MNQLGLIQPGTTGGEVTVTRLAKTQAHGNGAWARNDDGTTKLEVRLAPLVPASARDLGFRVQKVDLAQITKISAFISAADITPALMATGADAFGSLAVTNGVIPALSFPTVPAGTKRTLSIQGFDGAGNPVAGATIKSLFDNGGSSGSFEVSPRTTPAASILAGLTPAAAANVTTSDLNGFVDSATGVPAGSVYPHVYATHPALIDQTQLISDLTTAGGSVGALTASSYRMPGARVQVSFWLPPEMSTADQPSVFIEDPASPSYLIPARTADGSTPFNAGGVGESIAVSITGENRVTVTFNSVSPGTWKVGAFISGDGTSPNAKYYASPLDSSRASTVVSTAVSVADAKRTNPIQQPFLASSAEPVEPHYAYGRFRWRNTGATPEVQTADETQAVGLMAAIAAASSTDLKVYVGSKSTAYNLTGNLTLPAGKPVQLLGPDYFSPPPSDPRKDSRRPVLTGGGSMQINDPGQVVQDLRLRAMNVQMNTGGILQRLTLDSLSPASGAFAAIMFNPGAPAGFATLDSLHIYDINHAGTAPGDSLAVIALAGQAEGLIKNVLVDNYDDAGALSGSVRHNNGGPAPTVGIQVGSAQGVKVADCEIRALNQGATVLGGEAGGITHEGSAATGQGVDNCTVAGLTAATKVRGISLVMGTVSNCDVFDLHHPVGTPMAIWGIEVGGMGVNSDVTALNNEIRNLGSPQTGAGAIVEAIHGNAPNGATTLAILGNKINNNQSCVFEGIVVNDSASSSEMALVRGNQISGNQNVSDGNARFRGINHMFPGPMASLTIQDNDISTNTMIEDAIGVRTQLSAGNAAVLRNRISGNTLDHAGTTPSWAMVQLDDTGTTTSRAERNIVTGNTLMDNTGITSFGVFHGLYAVGSSTTGMDLVNNAVYNNTFTAGSGDTPTLNLVRIASPGKVISNRIYANLYNGLNVNAMGKSPIRINHYASGLTTEVDHNIVAEASLGTQGSEHAISASGNTGSTITVSSNSIYLGGGNSRMVAWAPGNGNLNVQDNVFAAGATGTPPAPVGQSGGTPATITVSFNSYFRTGSNYSQAYEGAGSPTLSNNVAEASMPFSNVANFLTDHAMLFGFGTLGSDGTSPRGVNGGTAGAPYVLSPEPLWP